MRLPAALDAALTAECWRLAHDFTREIVAEWKAWLPGSAPLAAIALVGLVDPESVRLPAWSWAILIFVAGLVAAMFRVYRDLRQRHDSLEARLASGGLAGPFIL